MGILFLFPIGQSDIDNLLLDHVGLPQVVIVAVHLVVGCTPWDFSVSPSPLGLDFGTLDFGTSD